MDPNNPDKTADPADDVSIEDAVRASLDMADADAFTADEDEDELPAKAEPEVAAKPDSAADGKAAEAKADDKAADKVEPDPASADKAAVDAEIKDLGIKNVRAQERFRALTQEASEGRAAKAQIAELEGFRERAQQWEQVIASTGAPPAQLGGALEALKLGNTGTRADAERAVAMAREFITSLATRHGLDVAGVDPLEGHADLQQQIADGDITRAVAAETARLRNATRERETADTQRSEADRQGADIRAGAAAVDALCGQLKATDPRYAEKFALLQPLIPDLGQNLPPAQWSAAFKRMYDNVRLPDPPADTRRAGDAPVRRHAGGGGAAEPKTAEDAVRQALGL